MAESIVEASRIEPRKTHWEKGLVNPTAERILERMQPLLELPIEIVLLTHGAPTDSG